MCNTQSVAAVQHKLQYHNINTHTYTHARTHTAESTWEWRHHRIHLCVVMSHSHCGVAHHTLRVSVSASFLISFFILFFSGSCAIGFYVHTTYNTTTARGYYVRTTHSKITHRLSHRQNRNDRSKVHYFWPLKNVILTQNITTWVRDYSYNDNILFYNKTALFHTYKLVLRVRRSQQIFPSNSSS